MSDVAIKIENLGKKYKLGAIGGTTLNAELQSWWARKRGKEDPNLKIGQDGSRYGDEFWALKDINLEIKKGEALGIIGANGAGKSTLLKILSRVTAPTEGDIWIDGRISSMLEVGTGFHGELTGRENIYMNGAILGMTKKEIDSKIESIIDFSECRQFIDTPVKRYSSGMYVKLAFAVASHLDAEIMVMDEVLAVGDMAFQKKCLTKMGDEAHGGKTVLYVSHNMATIRNLCTRCIVLDKGKVIFDGEVEKAITVYMKNAEGELKSKYILDTKKVSFLDYGKAFQIRSLEFIDKDYPIFDTEEKMHIRLGWRIIQPIEDVRIRLEIKYADGMIVGMTESKPFITFCDKQEGFSDFLFSMKNLAAGTYFFRLSVFTLNSMGVHTGLNDIPEKIYFKVVDTLSNRTGWLRQYWGSVRFDEIELKNV
jgi:lipopolysaccharide transport system ATP-binding protein